MGDHERDKGKQKMPEEFGESTVGSARRMQARTWSPGGQNSAGGNPFLNPLDLRDDGSRTWPWRQQQPAALGGGEEGDRLRLGLQTLDFISQIDRPRPQHQESGGVGNPDGGNRTSSPRPQQQPAAQGAGEEGDRVRVVRLQMQYLMSQVPSIKDYIRATLAVLIADDGDEKGEDGSSGVRSPGTLLQMNFARDSRMTEAQPAANTGQPEAASGASGSGQPQPPADAEQQFIIRDLFRCLMPSSDAGWTHDLQVPEDQRCPGCDYFPGPFTLEPPQHFCICDVCRELTIFCETCISSRQPPRKGES